MMIGTDALLNTPLRLNGSSPLETARPAPPSSSDLRQARMAQNFSHIIAVLMRDPQYRNLRLADLEWLVLPPVMAGQYKIGQTSAAGSASDQSRAELVVPAAVALWARVSPSIDRRLTEAAGGQGGLAFNEWASGDIVWLMAVAGDTRIVSRLLQDLKTTEFKDQVVKTRMAGPDQRRNDNRPA